MEATILLSESPKNEQGDIFIGLSKARQLTDHPPVLRCDCLLAKGVRTPCLKFYKVLKNDTRIIEVRTNDLRSFDPVHQHIKIACCLHSPLSPAFSLPPEECMFFGFASRIRAMEHAKAGALKYIGKLIEEGEKSYNLLAQYREVHYDDLNIHLTDRNIRKLEHELASAGKSQ